MLLDLAQIFGEVSRQMVDARRISYLLIKLACSRARVNADVVCRIVADRLFVPLVTPINLKGTMP